MLLTILTLRYSLYQGDRLTPNGYSGTQRRILTHWCSVNWKTGRGPRPIGRYSPRPIALRTDLLTRLNCNEMLCSRHSMCLAIDVADMGRINAMSGTRTTAAVARMTINSHRARRRLSAIITKMRCAVDQISNGPDLLARIGGDGQGTGGQDGGNEGAKRT